MQQATTVHRTCDVPRLTGVSAHVSGARGAHVIFAYLDIAVATDISSSHDEGNAILVACLQGCAGMPALSACK
jgi:hypothetical protein